MSRCQSMKIARGWILSLPACMLAILLAGGLSQAWAQDNPAPTAGSSSDSSSNGGQQPQEPTPAYGQEDMPPPISENPPISGLDTPSLEPHAAPLSYIQPGATLSESADSNVANNLGGGSFGSISRALGSLTLQRLWSHYDLALDYIGGAAYYDLPGLGLKTLQQADFDQKITWKRGQLSLRDSFSYLPEGNFGGAYGSEGSQGIASLGNTAFGSFWGGSGLGTLGLAPRILNVSLADLSENLTPKSALTAAGGYAFTHFYGSDESGVSFIGSSQFSGQVGYDRLLTSHTQIALIYGYQGFDFSVLGTAFHSHVIQGMYGHRISGRLDLLLGAGPQLTFIDSQSAVCSDPTLSGIACLLSGDTLVPVTVKNTKVGVAAQGRLRYKFPKTYFDLWYQRYETSGSGLFAGAQSDVVRLSVQRPLTRVWSAFADIGYSRNARIQPLTPAEITQCAMAQSSPGSNVVCPANDANTYAYGFLGGGVHRAIGRNFHAFVSYQFNELDFNRTYCLTSSSLCNRIGNRQVTTFGLDWTPRPIRID